MTNDSLQYANLRIIPVGRGCLELTQPNLLRNAEPGMGSAQVTQGSVQLVLKTSKDRDFRSLWTTCSVVWLSS